MLLKYFHCILAAYFLASCASSHTPISTQTPNQVISSHKDETVHGDSLSEADNEFLESISMPTPRLEDLLGTDGKPLSSNSVKSGDELDNHDCVDCLSKEDNEFLESIGTPVAPLEEIIGADGKPLAP